MGDRNRVKYVEPENESERLTLQHRWMKYHLGKPIFAPLDLKQPNLRILESSTGNGKSRRLRKEVHIVMCFLISVPGMNRI